MIAMSRYTGSGNELPVLSRSMRRFLRFITYIQVLVSLGGDSAYLGNVRYHTVRRSPLQT